jgi:hypothetical protein
MKINERLPLLQFGNSNNNNWVKASIIASTIPFIMSSCTNNTSGDTFEQHILTKEENYDDYLKNLNDEKNYYKKLSDEDISNWNRYTDQLLKDLNRTVKASYADINDDGIPELLLLNPKGECTAFDIKNRERYVRKSNNERFFAAPEPIKGDDTVFVKTPESEPVDKITRFMDRLVYEINKQNSVGRLNKKSPCDITFFNPSAVVGFDLRTYNMYYSIDQLSGSVKL